MSNVTYFLGAGASANTIPVVNQMLARFEDVVFFLLDRTREILNDEAYNKLPEAIKDNADILYSIIDDIIWLRQEASDL